MQRKCIYIGPKCTYSYRDYSKATVYIICLHGPLYPKPLRNPSRNLKQEPFFKVHEPLGLTLSRKNLLLNFENLYKEVIIRNPKKVGCFKVDPREQAPRAP